MMTDRNSDLLFGAVYLEKWEVAMPLFYILLTFAVGFAAGYLARSASIHPSRKRFAPATFRRRAF
jgi:hypothetical protein